MLPDKKTYFAEVILPLYLRGTYTYRVPTQFVEHLKVGQRVVVQFGKRKVYSSVVVDIHDRPPKEYAAKYLLDILDREPLVLPFQIEFWKWMADYYMCSLGDVMKAALPSGLSLSSESKIVLNLEFDNFEKLDAREKQVIEALGIQNELNAEQIATIIGLKSSYNVIRSLLEKRAVFMEEELKQKTKVKIETYVELSPEYDSESALQALFDKIEKRAPKQVAALLKYLEMSRYFTEDRIPIKRKALQKASGVSAATLKGLINNSIFIEDRVEVGRLIDANAVNGKGLTLSEAQHRAWKETEVGLDKKGVVLLHGITSSGKTEIYIQLIEDALKRGEQVLYLVPEIALTTQLIRRLQRYFGDKVGIFHSKFSNNERVEVWTDLIKQKHHDHRIIIGARSAIFVPLPNLKLIIVDEEHDSSFKQYDPAPRYQARDSAIKLAHITGAKVVLGSATPSMESFQCLANVLSSIRLCFNAS